jgi:hypothetical protein
VAAAIALIVLIGCEKTPMDVLIPNRAPSVSLSAAPIRDSTDIFIATFNWHASDRDGEVEYFRYAIDDTAAATDWFVTDDFELTLFFTAPDSARVDSIYVGAGTVPLERYVFNGAHTFFIKAVDDDGAESVPAVTSFTAETIAPETQILNPVSGTVVNLGPTFTVIWEGRDHDGTEPPVAYSWRLVRVENVVIMRDEEIENALLDPGSDGEPWSPFEPRTSVRLTDLATPGQYVFGVRAVDQAGAIEPRMRTFRAPGATNVLLIRSEPEGGRPRLRVSTSVKSVDFPTGDVRRKTFQIPANTDVLFTWVADAGFYGGTVAGYSWGLDLDDLDDDNPGWAPESATLTQTRLNFSMPVGASTVEHIFYVRVRDDVGSTLIGDVSLIVVPLRFERDVLLVDDWGRDGRGRDYPESGPHCRRQSAGGELPDAEIVGSTHFPHDHCHDAHLRLLIEAALDQLGHEEWVVDRYEPLDPIHGRALDGRVDIDSLSHPYWEITGPVTLEQLARYKLVIWNTKSSPANALKRMNLEGEDNFLAVYLDAGGKLWISGTGVYVRTLQGEHTVPDVERFGTRPEDFVYRYLKVRSVWNGAECVEGCFRQSGSTPLHQRNNGFEGAYPSTTAEREGFPHLRVSRPPYAGNPYAGVPGCDAMVIGIEMNPILRASGGRLDTVYFYQSNWKLEVNPPGHSWMDDGAVGLRYSGPDQGPLYMCGKPFFYLPDDEAVGELTAGIRWLLEN